MVALPSVVSKVSAAAFTWVEMTSLKNLDDNIFKNLGEDIISLKIMALGQARFLRAFTWSDTVEL